MNNTLCIHRIQYGTTAYAYKHKTKFSMLWLTILKDKTEVISKAEQYQVKILTLLVPGGKIIDNGQFRPWAVGIPFQSTLVGISFQCYS